ncbi:MAG: hypothetical protein ATN36_04650 [Epulopiscium sp. Nele67-Bin005]|nr:MAG: hypothetical protein ATN36_04650 [Epulopiscium sp. Nele67-Bin005]
MLMTQESFDKLEKELEYLKSHKRGEIAKNLKKAADFGDLKENAEFVAEREHQAVVEARIATIEHTLRIATIVSQNNIEGSDKVVTLGSFITLLDIEENDEEEFTLVDNIQADPLEGKVSIDSPLGKAVFNHKVNDVVELNVPAGIISYKILKIN